MASFGRAFQLAKHVLLRSLSLTARTTRTQLLRCYHTPPAALHQKLLPVIVPLHSSSRVHVRRVFSSSRRQPALQLHCASIQPSMSALHIPLYTNFKRTFHQTSTSETQLQSGLLPSMLTHHPLPNRTWVSAVHHPHTSYQTQRMYCADASKYLLVVPSLGDSITECSVVSWMRGVGDYVQVDEAVVVIESEKISVDIRAEKAGVITEKFAEEGDVVEIKAKLASIDTTAKAPPPSETKAAPEQPVVDVDAAKPSKPVAAQAPAPSAPAASQRAVPSTSTPTPSSSVPPGSRQERRVTMSRMRQTIARRLKDAQNNAAMLTTFNEIDMTAIMELRKQYKEEFLKKHSTKLGFMSIFVKASVAALQEQPVVNARIDGTDFVYHDFVDISVAVATPTGLVVPVLRNCQDMSFQQVEASIAELGQKAKKGQIALEDMVGGTFTISNGGVYGSLMGTPIINPPQSAILGMHGIFKRSVVINDAAQIRPMMYVALTYDHRIIDGREAVTFLRKIKSCVEEPYRIMLDL